MTTTALDTITQAAVSNGYSQQKLSGGAVMHYRWRGRSVTAVFHEKGSVLAAFTRRPNPFNDGFTVTTLSTNKKELILKFLRGEA